MARDSRPLPYHLGHLAPAEEFIRSMVAETFQFRTTLWVGPEVLDAMRREQRKQLAQAKARFRNQVRGLVGALRLVRHARLGFTHPKAKHPTTLEENASQTLALLHATSRGWVEEVETIHGESWDDFHVAEEYVGVAAALPTGRWLRAGGRE